MKCPKCGSDKLHVLDRRIKQGLIQRKRECLNCDHRFNTVEITQAKWDDVVAVWNIKHDLMRYAQIFSHIVQNIVDGIPDNSERKYNGKT